MGSLCGHAPREPPCLYNTPSTRTSALREIDALENGSE